MMVCEPKHVGVFYCKFQSSGAFSWMNKTFDNIRMHGMTVRIWILAFKFVCGNKNTKGIKLQHRTKKPRAIFPHFGHFQFAEQYKVKTIICYTPSNFNSWLPSD